MAFSTDVTKAKLTWIDWFSDYLLRLLICNLRQAVSVDHPIVFLVNIVTGLALIYFTQLMSPLWFPQQLVQLFWLSLSVNQHWQILSERSIKMMVSDLSWSSLHNIFFYKCSTEGNALRMQYSLLWNKYKHVDQFWRSKLGFRQFKVKQCHLKGLMFNFALLELIENM